MWLAVSLAANACSRERPVASTSRSHFSIPPGPRAVAIVVDDALAPGPPKSGILAARENRGILDRDAALICVAIQRPGLQLPAREFSFVHQQVKRMPVVVTLLADGMESPLRIPPPESSQSNWIRSQFELHSIISDFPTRVAQRAECGALFIQRGIRIVEMDEHATHVPGVLQLFKQPVGF